LGLEDGRPHLGLDRGWEGNHADVLHAGHVCWGLCMPSSQTDWPSAGQRHGFRTQPGLLAAGSRGKVQETLAIIPMWKSELSTDLLLRKVRRLRRTLHDPFLPAKALRKVTTSFLHGQRHGHMIRGKYPSPGTYVYWGSLAPQPPSSPAKCPMFTRKLAYKYKTTVFSNISV
jgi:hypothetical protein